MNPSEARKVIFKSKEAFDNARMIMADHADEVTRLVCEKAGNDPAFTKLFFDVLKTVKDEDVGEEDSL